MEYKRLQIKERFATDDLNIIFNNCTNLDDLIEKLTACKKNSSATSVKLSSVQNSKHRNRSYIYWLRIL
jgi:hypothetical protein